MRPVEPWDDVGDEETFAERFHRQWLAAQARRTPRTFPAEGPSARRPQAVLQPDGRFAYFGRRSAIATADDIVAELRRDPARRVDIAVPRGAAPRAALDLAVRLRHETRIEVAVTRSPAPAAAGLEGVRANRAAVFSAFWPEEDR